MKLIWHEFLTTARRWRPFIAIGWILVLIHLGYQCQWWWPGPELDDKGIEIWSPKTRIHDAILGTVSALILTALALVPLVLFLPLSPMSKVNRRPLIPISRMDLISSRAAFLFAFLFTPLLLHEAVYLLFDAEVSLPFTLVACAERLGLLLSLALGFASLAWISGTLKKALTSLVFIIAIVSVSLYLLEMIPATSPLVAYSYDFLRPEFTSSTAYGSLFTFLYFSAALAALYLFARHSSASMRGKHWIPLAAICVLFALVNTSATQGIKRLHWMSAEESEVLQEIGPSVRVNHKQSTSSFYTAPAEEKGEEIHWSLTPSIENLPGSLLPISRAKGTLHFHRGETVSMETSKSSEFGWRYTGMYEPETNAAIRQAPGFILYGDHQNTIPNGVISLKSTSPLPGLKSGDRALDATASLESGLWQLGEWKKLALDGSWQEFGSLGKSRVVSIHEDRGGIGIRIHGQEISLMSFPDKAQKPRRIFLLRHKPSRKCILIGHHQGQYATRASLSAVPVVDIDLTAPKYDVPGDFSVSQWAKEAEFFMLETRWIGNIERVVEQNDAGAWMDGFTEFPPNPIRPSVNTSPEEIVSLLEKPGLSESDLRLHLYRLIRDYQYGFELKSVHESYQAILRQHAWDTPSSLTAFRHILQESDRDWWLDQIEGDNHPDFLHVDLAAQKGWFRGEEELLARLIAMRSTWSAASYQAAAEMGIEGTEKASFRSRLARFEPSLDRSRYPDLWKKKKQDLERRWEKQRPRARLIGSYLGDGISLGRMGEEEPLREILAIFLLAPNDIENRRPAGHKPWDQLETAFHPDLTSGIDSLSAKIELAQQLLDSDWRYDPDTFQFSIAP